MGAELLRSIDAIHRDKDIDREYLFESIEQALLTVLRKKYESEELRVIIDRESGEFAAYDAEGKALPGSLLQGRIAAQAAKQVLLQKIREAERDVLSRDFSDRIHKIVNGTVQNFEGDNLIVNLGRVEGFLPRSERVRGDPYHSGDRIRALVLEVRKVGQKVRVLLSRSHPDLIRELFRLEVPEIAENIIEIVRIAREAGFRTKIAVNSTDPKIDCVGACVGVRGARIKAIIDELGGEKIDVIRWSDEPGMLIGNALKPAVASSIQLEPPSQSALVTVAPDQLALAIGKKGQNVRLAARLAQWDLTMVCPDEEGKITARKDSELLEREGLLALPPDQRHPPPAPEAPADAVASPEATEATGATEATESTGTEEPTAVSGTPETAEATGAAETTGTPEAAGTQESPEATAADGESGEPSGESPAGESPAGEANAAGRASVEESGGEESPTSDEPVTGPPAPAGQDERAERERSEELRENRAKPNEG